MKRTLCAIIAAALLVSSAPAKRAEAAETEGQDKPRFGLSLRTDILSKYIFRGFTYFEEPVAQPTIAASYGNDRYGNITLAGFGNFDMNLAKLNELDLMVEYAKQLGKLKLAAGYGQFTFPNTTLPETQEFYGTASIDTLLNPTITAVYDFDQGEGIYAEGGISHNIEVGKIDSTTFTLSASAKLGYNNHYFMTDSGFSHAEASLALPITNGKLTLIPSITRTEALNKNFQSRTWGGVRIEYKF